ncbi:uroporphyrinogen decarboxylase [Zhouia sp. PK063]|uniref:uroporphyrinogen decarboxylase n=1 Tax=Zhouia sp. PK063 TaxID=3373602 RepID=UPI0037A07B64
MEFLGISLTDWIGYIAMALLMLSFTFKKVNVLRTVNALGCVFFVMYGFMLNWAWPIIISNGFILMVNVYYLFFKKKA